MTPSLTIALLVLISLIILSWHNAKNADGIDRRLLEAVKGNRGLARRLLKHARVKHPGQSDRWYVEKVIYDLERDRAGSGSCKSSYRVNQREMRDNI